jgi:hypothetical protein
MIEAVSRLMAGLSPRERIAGPEPPLAGDNAGIGRYLAPEEWPSPEQTRS